MSRTCTMALHSAFPESANIECKLVSRIIIRLLIFEGARGHTGAFWEQSCLEVHEIKETISWRKP